MMPYKVQCITMWNDNISTLVDSIFKIKEMNISSHVNDQLSSMSTERAQSLTLSDWEYFRVIRWIANFILMIKKFVIYVVIQMYGLHDHHARIISALFYITYWCLVKRTCLFLTQDYCNFCYQQFLGIVLKNKKNRSLCPPVVALISKLRLNHLHALQMERQIIT